MVLEVPWADPVVPEDPWVVPVVPDLICLLGAVAVGIMDQVLWITEVLSEVEVETSIEEVPGVPEVLEAEVQVVQVDLAHGVVIVGVTKTNVGGSKQDKTRPDLLFSSIFQFNP